MRPSEDGRREQEPFSLWSAIDLVLQRANYPRTPPGGWVVRFPGNRAFTETYLGGALLGRSRATHVGHAERFATREQAEAALREFQARFPKSETVSCGEVVCLAEEGR